jgi:hypothetical protein
MTVLDCIAAGNVATTVAGIIIGEHDWYGKIIVDTRRVASRNEL